MVGPITYKAVDANSGAPIEGCAVYDTVNTTCCNCFGGGCSGCNGCTSGNGYNITGNTDSSGQLTEDMQFSCPSSHSCLFTANGYNNTKITFNTGSLTGPVAAPVAQMVANNYVPQSNQGAAGTAQQAGSTAQSAASNQVPQVSPSELILVGVVAVAAILFIILVVVYG